MDFRPLSFDPAPSITTPPPGPCSQKYLAFQATHEAAAVSYPRGFPCALARGRGATVEDVDGNVYIDFFGGAGVMAVGHANPEVVAAADAQLKQLTHALDLPTPARQDLVERLREVLPPALTRVFFGGPTGSDAVESAMKLARLNTGRAPFIAFEGGYHGMTSGALSLSSGRSFKDRLLPLVAEVHFVPYAYCYRCAFGKTKDTCDTQCAKHLDHVLEDPHSGIGTPAAVIVEPIQGEGGSIVPPPGFLPKVREICDRHHVLLVADEIQAGFCRTGKMFAFEHTGTVPDIMTMSKALGGLGFPISAIAYKENLNTWGPGAHIGTFRGNVIAYAAGAAALRFMCEHDLAGHAARLGERLLTLLQEVERESPFVGEARGKGLMLGVEFVKDKSTKEPAPELASRVRSLCFTRGLLIEIGGHYSNVARFLPPLVLTEELARKGAEIFAESVTDLGK
jgi:diaminobutyrate-2-oxoglutarate transaminase